eukprot:GFUD01029496.1.p1 GENE.GFUD01029496.1~~GFUD01029496.1.p1  ORF type:complete len:313 (+),score=95.73 GFUD01029496.1:110-1048(+)
MFYSDIDNQDARNGEKSGSSITLTAPPKRTGSDSSEEEKDGTGRIRVGREYQAVLPSYIPPSERRAEQTAERALLVWSPSVEEDAKLDKFTKTAKYRYGYNTEQALGMLFWHKHNMDRALQDLANFTPYPDEWSVEDKALFELAFKLHGKSQQRFQRIQEMLPEKSIATLVKYYYSWKMTSSSTQTSLMVRQAKKLSVVREEVLTGEENCNEPVNDSDMVEVTDPADETSIHTNEEEWRQVPSQEQLTASQGKEPQARRPGSFSQQPTWAGRGDSGGFGQRNSQLQAVGAEKITSYRTEQPDDLLCARWTGQ